jgi:hypothetical protein
MFTILLYYKNGSYLEFVTLALAFEVELFRFKGPDSLLAFRNVLLSPLILFSKGYVIKSHDDDDDDNFLNVEE